MQERFYFGDHVLPCFETGIPLLKKRLQELPDADNVVCNKVREGDNRIVRLKEGNPAGRHVVIVDDLVQSGGTLIECQKVLAANGAAKVSAYVTHAVFPKRSWERFTHENSEGSEKGFEYFWITDSCPITVKALAGRAPFERECQLTKQLEKLPNHIESNGFWYKCSFIDEMELEGLYSNEDGVNLSNGKILLVAEGGRNIDTLRRQIH
ncbi:hypothetical protein ACLOJK_037321 [Asimina triloba]